MKTRPDFSPANLSKFLRIRLAVLECRHTATCKACSRCRGKYLENRRKEAGLTTAQMYAALIGRLNAAGPRDRLWRAIGCAPADHGIRLLGGGKQEGL